MKWPMFYHLNCSISLISAFLCKSDVPAQTNICGVCHRTSGVCNACFINSPSLVLTVASKSLDHTLLGDEHSASWKAEHNTPLRKVLQGKHDNVHIQVGAAHYKPLPYRESQMTNMYTDNRMPSLNWKRIGAKKSLSLHEIRVTRNRSWTCCCKFYLCRIAALTRSTSALKIGRHRSIEK